MVFWVHIDLTRNRSWFALHSSTERAAVSILQNETPKCQGRQGTKAEVDGVLQHGLRRVVRIP
jgi:hypothetical protein